MIRRITARINHRVSLLALIFSLMVVAYYYGRNAHLYSLSWDVYGYYLYLPQTFIHQDLAMEKDEEVQLSRKVYPIGGTFYQRSKTETGKWVLKYPMGMAYLYLPAFLTGQAIACWSDGYVDGFSPPYERAMWVWSFISVVVGLFFLRRILLHFFSDRLTAFLILLMAMGTNYLITVTHSVAMPHNFLFTLTAINLWLTIRWWENHQLKYAILIGIVSGIMITARFTSAIFLIIPFFWGTGLSRTEIRKRFVFLFRHKIKHLLVIIALIFMCFFPQMLYWKSVSGHWIYDSYNNAGEGLDLLSPYTYSFLFSYRKGWLLYTPLMIFAIAGLYFLWRNKREYFFPLLSFFIINLWVVSSWTNWWYAESFSQRPMVDSYAISALMLGFFADAMLKKKKWIRILAPVLLLLTAAFTFFQHWQYNNGIIHGSRMTGDYYWASFGSTKYNGELDSLLLINRSFDEKEVFVDENKYERKLWCNFTFDQRDESWDAGRFDTVTGSPGNLCFRLDSLNPYSPDFRMPANAFMKKDHAWIRATARIFSPLSSEQSRIWIVITFLHKGKCYKYMASEAASKKRIAGQWNELSFDYLTPEIRSTEDELQVYLWSVDNKTAWVDQMRVYVFSPGEK